MKPETAKALYEVGKAIAKLHGFEGEIIMTVNCRTEEVPCKHKWKRKYVEENETVRMFRICKICGYEKEVNGLVCYGE